MQSPVGPDSNGRIFSGKERQKELHEELKLAGEVALEVGARTVVFSSPGLRNGTFLENPTHFDEATDFLLGLSEIGKHLGIRYMVEPCPEAYGCDFGRDLREVATLLSSVGMSDGLGLHLNTASLMLEEEMMKASLFAHGGSSYHIDVSDPFYRPMGEDSLTVHQRIASVLGRLREMGHGPRWITVSGKRPRGYPEADLLPLLRATMERVSSTYLQVAV